MRLQKQVILSAPALLQTSGDEVAITNSADIIYLYPKPGPDLRKDIKSNKLRFNSGNLQLFNGTNCSLTQSAPYPPRYNEAINESMNEYWENTAESNSSLYRQRKMWEIGNKNATLKFQQMHSFVGTYR